MLSQDIPRQTRRTRIVCISDTHCQTPKLPKGDVLIHAGDLTNQGSYSELKKTVDWLEKADFEAKIVVAGNHDITLDSGFYKEHGSSWRWPQPQDPDACRRLLTQSKSITYLENEAAKIYLNVMNGPRTCFKVYGSPCTPKAWNWAFQYEAEEATNLWDTIPQDTDIVVTHTPPKGHCDAATKDDRSGCGVLLQALHRVRPMLAVFGHIHEARGVERVRWTPSPDNGCLVEEFEVWKDPGVGSNKQSLVSLTTKGGCPPGNGSRLTRQSRILTLSQGEDGCGGQPAAQASGVLQPFTLKSTSRPDGVSQSEAKFRAMLGGAFEYRQEGAASDVGLAKDAPDVEATERKETVMINAAFLGPRLSGTASKVFNKPVVVDVDLPVWCFDTDAE
ncbi:Metallo-dependent phosphatase [Lentithecium fluviatile CBS 122367]|uniref:Metallo-dependent phosphatase n=1 Tax=Lentithecium fluviatile CBS 122367 TaxID=1168545 RepID=A0A6G1J727_9PLEO|nr:Metallo-dependent phosphatase [Lentithecium fluviatile CBS 122367]